MIYTGYYAKLKKYEELGIEPIAISGKRPDFYEGLYYVEFAPRFWMYERWKKGESTNEGYSESYEGYLETLDKAEIREDFKPYVGEGKDCVLLCYEKSGDFCHRHVLADWLEKKFGWKIEEFEV